jgi:hypothetical protein
VIYEFRLWYYRLKIVMFVWMFSSRRVPIYCVNLVLVLSNDPFIVSLHWVYFLSFSLQFLRAIKNNDHEFQTYRIFIHSTLTPATVKTLPSCEDENRSWNRRNRTTWSKRWKRSVFLPWKSSNRKGTCVSNWTVTRERRFSFKVMEKANRNDEGRTRILHRHNASATWTI